MSFDSNDVKLREYQETAIQSWERNGFCGLFEMATGTGKTITSLSCAKVLLEREGCLHLIILVPILPLASQWEQEVKKYLKLTNVISANSQHSNWYKDALFQINQLDGKNSFCLISTYATFLTGRFQSILKQISKNAFLIADEVHNFGTNRHIAKYPHHIERRLGLSATPHRHFDDIGTSSIFNYFKAKEEPTFKFGMGEAIDSGYLCEYFYYPRLVSLNSSELDEYKSISLRLLKYYNQETQRFDENSKVTALLLKRKQIIHKASNKLNVFREILKDVVEANETRYVLVYVPEGNEIDGTDKKSRLIDVYSKIIAFEFGLSQHQFIGTTVDRDAILTQFSKGKIAVLTAMKCLDEGVDIKRAEIAIFCSSTGNPRQFVQRRGRILRLHSGKKYAIIYDMIVVPEISNQYFEDSLWMEKQLLRNELRRVHEFAGLSLNHYQALETLEKKANEFGIDIYSEL